jgi:hypothetical protein
MMVNAWMVIAALAPTAAALVREVLGLCRYALRRISIERVVATTVLPGSRVVDRDDNGALFELAIERRSPELPAGSDHERKPAG